MDGVSFGVPGGDVEGCLIDCDDECGLCVVRHVGGGVGGGGGVVATTTTERRTEPTVSLLEKRSDRHDGGW